MFPTYRITVFLFRFRRDFVKMKIVDQLKIYMLFSGLGWAVLGKRVPEVLSDPRPRAQFFPIQTNLGRQITYLLFSISIIVCFLFHYLHFTFFAVKKKTAAKDAKAGKLVAVRTRGLDGKIRTAGARAIRFKDLGFRTAQMHEKIIKINMQLPKVLACFAE